MNCSGLHVPSSSSFLAWLECNRSVRRELRGCKYVTKMTVTVTRNRLEVLSRPHLTLTTAKHTTILLIPYAFTSSLHLFHCNMLSGVFYQFFLLLYPTCQRYELWVISLGKFCREAGSWWTAVKRSNWAFNHADILTALNLSWGCASESVRRGGLWFDHQDTTPDFSEAGGMKLEMVVSRGNQSISAARSSVGTPALILGILIDAGTNVAVGCRNIVFSWCRVLNLASDAKPNC